MFWPEATAWVETAILAGDQLMPGDTVEGPALIERLGTTVAIPPRTLATVDPHRNIVLSFIGAGEQQP